ncbi:hypothetical protein FRC03_000974 [Tulasnella sp. 419]|nr:hypothetical protein FRC03_000974 [Tulasnella sp. 419]
MEPNPSPIRITPLSPSDPTSDSPDNEVSLPFILESIDEVADSIQVLARSVLLFELSALYLAEQASLRAHAFNAWVATIEGELEPRLEQRYESLVAEEETYSQFLAFRLQKAERLETLRGHFASVKKLLNFCVDGELQDLVVDDGMILAYIVAWIMITSAEELKNALDVDLQNAATAAFVRAVRDDLIECRKMSRHNQKKPELGRSTYDEICRELLDDLLSHFDMSTDVIFDKKSNYTLSVFVDSFSKHYPLPVGMTKVLLEHEGQDQPDEPFLAVGVEKGEVEDLPAYHASPVAGPSTKTPLAKTSLSLFKLPNYSQISLFKKQVPKVVARLKISSSERLPPELKISSDASTKPDLQVAINVLELSRSFAKKIPLHRQPATTLIRQCDEVLVNIRDNAGKTDSSNLQAAINKTNETFTAIRLDMAKWSKYDTWRCWRERHIIEAKLHEYGILIRHNLDILWPAARLDGVSNIKEVKAMAEGDKRQLSEIKHEVQEIHALVSQLHDTRISNAPGSEKYEQADNTLLQLTTKPKPYVLRPHDVEGEVQQLDEHPLFYGTIYDIYKGLYLGEMFVAMKVLRGPGTAGARPQDIRRFERQLDLWRTMNIHKHVLHLIGYCLVNGNQMCLVTPWMENGDVGMYLYRNPEADRFQLIAEVAIGLEYLHSIHIFHGGLQSKNILVAKEGYAVLAGFGLTRLYQDDEPTFYTQSDGPISEFRYQPPEVMGGHPLSPSSDVYSWAMCALEIMTGHPPYYYIKPVGRLIKAINEHKFPEKSSYPSPITESYAGLWELFERCCNGDPNQRPSITQVLQTLEEIKARRDA